MTCMLKPNASSLILCVWAMTLSCLAEQAVFSGLLQRVTTKQASTAELQQASAKQILADARSQLQRQFDQFLIDPEAYRRKALKECGMFPEGNLYPFVLPALAYANLASSGSIPPEHAQHHMQKLLDLAIPLVAEQVEAPQQDLLQLSSTRKQGSFLSILNYTLGSYRLVTEDPRYDRLYRHLSYLLYVEIKEKQGAPIDSYPSYTWYFDTVMGLASLELFDRVCGSSLTPPLLEAHLAWLEHHALIENSGLPRAFPGESSRGSELSMQLCLWGNLMPKRAVQLYERYVAAHWLDLNFTAGFSEWPRGAKAPVTGDVDSGPVFFGIGSTASGMGLGAAQAVGDTQRLQRLAQEMDQAAKFLRGLLASEQGLPMLDWFSEGMQLDKSYYSGFLYGDTALFYALTWAPLPPGRTQTTAKPQRAQPEQP